MPFISSYLNESTGTSIIMPSTAIDFSMDMDGSFTKIPAFGRSASSFEAQEVAGTAARSKSLLFSTIPIETQSTGRLIVLLVTAYLNGKGSITSVIYGGQSLAKAIGSSSSNDKGAAEIWYGVFETNPSTNTVTVNASENIIRVRVCREVLLGMTNSAPYDTDIDKRGSEDFGQIVLAHPINGVTLATNIIWKNGITAVSATWSNTTESDETNGHEDPVAFSSSYYESASSSVRTIRCTWLGIQDANVETAGASWR